MTFTSADLLKFGLAKTRKAVRVPVVEPTSQAGGALHKVVQRDWLQSTRRVAVQRRFATHTQAKHYNCALRL